MWRRTGQSRLAGHGRPAAKFVGQRLNPEQPSRQRIRVSLQGPLRLLGRLDLKIHCHAEAASQRVAEAVHAATPTIKARNAGITGGDTITPLGAERGLHVPDRLQGDAI